MVGESRGVVFVTSAYSRGLYVNPGPGSRSVKQCRTSAAHLGVHVVGIRIGHTWGTQVGEFGNGECMRKPLQTLRL